MVYDGGTMVQQARSGNVACVSQNSKLKLKLIFKLQLNPLTNSLYKEKKGCFFFQNK
jgi:hypothetical protein